jgi:hypothetical protein
MRLRKNFSTKKIWPVSYIDSDPDSNPGFKSGIESGFESGPETGSGTETNFRPDPDPKPDPKLLFRICNTARRAKMTHKSRQ